MYRRHERPTSSFIEGARSSSIDQEADYVPSYPTHRLSAMTESAPGGPAGGGFTLQFGAVNLLSGLSSSSTMCHTRRMNTSSTTTRYKNHRFPAEIIGHGVWLLSFL